MGLNLSYRGSEQNKFFDQSTVYMRNLKPPEKSKMAAKGPQNGRWGLERGPFLGYWALRSTLAK